MRYRAGLIVACCSLLASVSCDRPDEASAASAPAPSTPPTAASAPTVPWQYQLQGPVDTGVDAGTFIIDGFDVDQSTVADLHRRGRTVICYVNAGAREEWRPDAARYPADIVGADLHDWPGERWLDIRRIDVLRPILADRFDMCRRKGFDGVEADNVDGHTQDSGLPLYYSRGFPVRSRTAAQRDVWSAGCGYIALPPVARRSACTRRDVRDDHVLPDGSGSGTSG